MNKETVNKQPPTLEQRIVGMLDNANAGSEALAELIQEIETAARAFVETAEAERAKSLDLVDCPDPREARERIAAAELAGDRLRTQLPKLRTELSTALMAESRERWFADYRRVRQKLDEAVKLFETYSEHAAAIAELFAAAAEVDREVSRVNGSAPDGVNHRLRSVELEARNLDRFTRDRPEIARTVQLPDFVESARMRWPAQTSTSFAAAYAGTTRAPSHLGQHWADPEVVASRRQEAEREHHRIGEFYQRQTEQQEDRINAEERGRFVASRRV